VIREERHGDVTRLVCTSLQSRSMGYSVSAYVVRGVLVDSGFAHIGRDLARWLDAHPVEGAAISHYHEDHAGNLPMLVARGVPVWIAPSTLAHVRDAERIFWYRRWCWGVPEPLKGDIISINPEPLHAIAAPGHSDDHHVIWDAETGTVFGADLFLGVKVRVSHPWPRENVRQQIASIRKVLALAPARFFDGHRGLVPHAAAQLAAKADWIEETAGQVDRYVDDSAIARRLFGREPWRNRVTQLDYSHRNLVASLRATIE
jgi:glyoxylase-like metal-dependent hydrolase (beta-lactamase superfamily II)